MVKMCNYRKANPILSAELVLSFNDGSKKFKDIAEGSTINNLVYLEQGVEKTISGRIKMISFSSKDSFNLGVDYTCLEKSKSVFNRQITIKSLIIDGSDNFESNVVMVDVKNIRDFDADRVVNESYSGNVHEVTPETKITEVMANVQAGDTVLIAEGNYVVDKLDVTKPVRITPQKNTDGSYQNVILAGLINVAIPEDITEGTVEIDHININVNSPLGTGATKNLAKGSALTVSSGVLPVDVHDNTFVGNNFYTVVSIEAGTVAPVNISGNKFEGSNYHAIEFKAAVDCRVYSGTVISNNYFVKGVSTHNHISMYNYEENASITISNNHFEESNNAIRLSCLENVKAELNIVGNTYDSTDITKYPDKVAFLDNNKDTFAGLLIIQVYKSDQNPANLTLNYSNNYFIPKNGQKILVDGVVNRAECQPFYVYFDNKDWNTGAVPTVNFNNTTDVE